MLAALRQRRRRRVGRQPFPDRWLDVVTREVPLYATLSEDDQRELQRHIIVFLDEKTFEGCGGLRVTEEMAVTIAAQACLLLLHRETEYFPTVSSILVYPETYAAPVVEESDDWFVTESLEDREGEASQHGTVVLSWAEAHADAHTRDGRNLVLHEFAHQLDMEDGEADGAPVLANRRQYAAWAEVLGREFERLRAAADRGAPTVLDSYGAEDPAEFFAVATECFFERPAALFAAHPRLYDQLRTYFQQDPVHHGRVQGGTKRAE